MRQVRERSFKLRRVLTLISVTVFLFSSAICQIGALHWSLIEASAQAANPPITFYTAGSGITCPGCNLAKPIVAGYGDLNIKTVEINDWRKFPPGVKRIPTLKIGDQSYTGDKDIKAALEAERERRAGLTTPGQATATPKQTVSPGPTSEDGFSDSSGDDSGGDGGGGGGGGSGGGGGLGNLSQLLPLLLALLMAQQAKPTVAPQTPVPTVSPLPTITLVPTVTPNPTHTATPTVTPTRTPTRPTQF